MINGIEFQKISDLPSFSDNFALVTHSISNLGAGLFLFVESSAKEQVRGTFEKSGCTFPKARIGDRKRFALVEMFDDQQVAYELPPLDVTFPLLDVFPDGRVFVAGGRSEWRSSDDYDKNGVVIDPIAGTQSDMLLGDGIESLSIDSLGRIWVSYFDEGVIGNFGWGHPGPEPLGASGLNCFVVDGDLLWSFPNDDEFGPITDCYAMNVHGATASVYFYTEFPLCQVSSEFQRSYWKTDLSGCHQFAINNSTVLFTGQYDDGPAIGHLGRLGNGRIQDLQKVKFNLPGASPISSGQLLARGAEMHYFDDSGWYRIRLDDVDV